LVELSREGVLERRGVSAESLTCPANIAIIFDECPVGAR
jgi:hypothetical protein